MMSELFRPGDEVIMKMDPEARSWGRPGPADGVRGKVLSKTRVLRYRERIGYRADTHGVYEIDGTCVVQWETGETTDGDDYSLVLADLQEAQRRQDVEWVQPVLKKNLDSYNEIKDRLLNTVRVGDLPPTLFWEQDRVHLLWRSGVTDGGAYGIVQTIQYQWEDFDKDPSYGVRLYDSMGRSRGLQYLRQSSLALAERGLVYKWYNKEPIQFKDLREEAELAKLLGRTVEVRNPLEGGLFKWNKDQIIDALKEGSAHGMCMGHNPFDTFGGSGTPYAIRFVDEDLGERVRKFTLSGFGISPFDIEK
jgi:hypothetical protein